MTVYGVPAGRDELMMYSAAITWTISGIALIWKGAVASGKWFALSMAITLCLLVSAQ